jgi:hypothetical protein
MVAAAPDGPPPLRLLRRRAHGIIRLFRNDEAETLTSRRGLCRFYSLCPLSLPRILPFLLFGPVTVSLFSMERWLHGDGVQRWSYPHVFNPSMYTGESTLYLDSEPFSGWKSTSHCLLAGLSRRTIWFWLGWGVVHSSTDYRFICQMLILPSPLLPPFF